jgi:cytochrome c553
MKSKLCAIKKVLSDPKLCVQTPCSKCGGDAPKYARMKLRRSGKRTLSVATYCVVCHAEDQKAREVKHYPKRLEYNRQWRKRNKKKERKYDRAWYRKKAFGVTHDIQLGLTYGICTLH